MNENETTPQTPQTVTVTPVKRPRPIKLKRKYRFLKPKEIVQHGDWVSATVNENRLEDLPGRRGWYQCIQGTVYDGWIDKPAGEDTSVEFARFVDCVPA